MATEPEMKRHQMVDALTDALKAMINGDNATAFDKIDEAHMLKEHLVERQEQNPNLSNELKVFEERQLNLSIAKGEVMP